MLFYLGNCGFTLFNIIFAVSVYCDNILYVSLLDGIDLSPISSPRPLSTSGTLEPS